VNEALARPPIRTPGKRTASGVMRAV
jgi:hypothetical protein